MSRKPPLTVTLKLKLPATLWKGRRPSVRSLNAACAEVYRRPLAKLALEAAKDALAQTS